MVFSLTSVQEVSNPLDDFQDIDIFDNFRCSSINRVDTNENVANQQLSIFMFKVLIMPVSQACNLDVVILGRTFLGRNFSFMFFSLKMSRWEGALSKKSKTFIL